MTKLWLLGTNTLREVVRHEAFSVTSFVFGILMIAFAQVVGNLTFGRADRVVRSIGLSGVGLGLDLLAILIGVALVHREIERKTALVVLTRPVPRPVFIVGRFLGLAMATTIAAMGFSFVFFLTLFSVRGAPQASDVAALFGSLLEAWVVGAFAIVLSCVTTPTLGTGVALGFLIAGTSIDDVVGLTQKDGGLNHVLAVGLSYVLPNLNRFNFREAAIYLEAPSFGLALQAAAYAACFVVAFLSVATLALRNKELL
ncbi:MAG: ABC transporter permease [Myxococcales bacterium]|nr:ABC transporter permease [Myxococcales bacterium]